MKSPFAKLDGTAQKVSDAADKATAIVRDSLGALVVLGVLSLAALILSTVAILSVRKK